MSEQFHISADTAATVMVSTTCIYVAFVVLVRCAGPRSLSSLSSFDFACTIALGAVLGRTVLLADPTLMIGLVALATFFTLQGVLGMLRTNVRLDRWMNRQPILLVSDGRLLRTNMRRAHIVENEIRYGLRRSGLRGLHDTRCVILERNGDLTVLADRPGLDPWLLADVVASADHDR